MRKLVFIVVLLLIAASFAGYKFISSRTAKISGLKVVSTPVASVFLNDKLIGKTPYEDKQAPGEYVLKLIPEDSVTGVSSWQGKIVLAPSLLTYVKRELGTSELTSAGEILTLEKISGNDTQIAVLSSPDGATVVVDGQEKGTTPYLSKDVVSGEHDVAVSSPGFVGRTVRVQAVSGYKLTATFQLALTSASPSAEVLSPTPTGKTGEEEKKISVVIKETPTGFLRVRSSPSTGASELAQVKPGEKFVLIEEKESWFKIEYEQGKEGWISSRYAQKE